MKDGASRYRKIRLLGEGGGGRVWLAEDALRPERSVALKELTGSTESNESALRREFATLRTLRHPNLAEVYDFEIGPTGEVRFALEYVDGLDLVSASRQEGAGSLAEFAAEALRALAFLHDLDVFHRDLKPSNILVRRQPHNGSRVVLLDFGLAVLREELASSGIAGTLPYLAPELLSGATPSRRSDLYGLGAVLYEAMHGSPPRLETPSGSNAVAPLIPARAIEAWIAQLVASDPSDRPSNARDALVRLNRICGMALEIETPATRSARLASGPPPGRDVERDLLSTLVERRDGPRVILLTGDAGIGKTRLLRWLGSHAVAMGWDVGVDLLRELAQAGTPAAEAMARWRTKAASHPTLVLLDELEVASQPVVDFVDSTARDHKGPPLVIVAALRAAETRNEMLRSLVEDVGSVPTIHRVDLRPMGRRDVAEVVRRATGASPADEHLDWLLEVSGGNPLVLETALVDGAWEQGKSAVFHPSIGDSIRARVDGLDGDTRLWLQALTVLGPGSGHEALRRVAGISETVAAHAAATAVDSGLAASDGAGWSPASRTVSIVVRNRIAPEDWRALHRAAAEAVETDGDLDRLARLWREAGEAERSIECAVRAANHSHSGRPSAAAASLGFALSQVAPADPRRLELRTAQAQYLVDAQHYAAAIRALGLVLRRATSDEERATVLARRGHLLASEGRGKQALRVAEAALALAMRSGVPAAIARAKRAQAAALGRLQRPEEALGIALEAAVGLAESGERAEQAACLFIAGACASNAGRYSEAGEYLRAVVDLAGAVGDQRLLSYAWISLTTLASRQRRFEDALRCVDQARKVIEASGLHALLHYALTCRATPLIRLGRLDAAFEAAKEATSVAAHHGNSNGLASSLLTQAEILLQVGRAGEAMALLTQALGEKREVEPRFIHYFKVTLAETLLDESQPDHERLGQLVQEVLDAPLVDRKCMFGALVVEMERRVIAGEEAGEIRTRFRTAVGEGDALLDADWETRAALAEAQEQLAAGVLEACLATARDALELATAKDLPALAARLYAVVSEAEQQAGRTGAAHEALDRARERLEEAASRIADEQMRADFLGRAVFRPIRRSALGRATVAEARLLAIYDMIRVLNSESDPDALLETMLDMAISVVHAERGMILLAEADGDYSVRATRNLETEAAADAEAFSRSVVLEAAAGTPVLAIDTGDDPRLRDLQSVSLYHIRSVMCVPLRSRGRRIGAVYLDNRSGGSLFSQDDLVFLEAFADHAALALENATLRRQLELENRRLRIATDSRTRLAALVGRSRGMQRVFDRIEKFAATALPVLILGESGTGKELVARAIHDLGPRRAKPFVVENCAAMTDTLLETELFGHVRGAFTGAERDRPGLFEQADGGTLFLDEVGDMSAAMQARLLRVLQEGEVRRVGDETRRRVDVRVVAATNKDLEAEVAAGRFRDDLRYRLHVLVVELPPLRERPGDVALLVEEILERIGRERGVPPPRIRRDVVDLLERSPWPGNVRQLENCLKRLAVHAGEAPITMDVVAADDGLAAALLRQGARPQPMLRIDRNEEEQIRLALAAAQGNRARAAKLLGISRATIFRKLKEHGIE